jgi:hypothetical protein
MGLIERAKSAAFGAAQAMSNEQGVHLLPEDRPLFDAAVDAALAVYQPPGAVEENERLRQAIREHRASVVAGGEPPNYVDEVLWEAAVDHEEDA